MYEMINVGFSGTHLTECSRTTDTPDIRLRSGITSFASTSDYLILPFPAHSNKTVTMNPTRSPEA